jgi:HD superfamily phosphohydrolase
MSRDSYFTGVGYGKTDVDRITKNIFFQDNKLCINPKVIPTVEHLIIGRNLLYRSTYFHRKVRAMDMNLSKIFARAKELYLDNKDLFIDELLAKSFEGKLKLDDFLLTNDSLIEFHLLKWKNSNDSILKDLVKRFYLRDKGFTAISKSWINIKKSDALNEIKKSFDEHYYFKEDIIKKTVYESEVYVKKYNNALVPLSKFSEIIKRVKDFDIHEEFIIGPSEIIKKNKGL